MHNFTINYVFQSEKITLIRVIYKLWFQITFFMFNINCCLILLDLEFVYSKKTLFQILYLFFYCKAFTICYLILFGNEIDLKKLELTMAVDLFLMILN